EEERPGEAGQARGGRGEDREREREQDAEPQRRARSREGAPVAPRERGSVRRTLLPPRGEMHRGHARERAAEPSPQRRDEHALEQEIEEGLEVLVLEPRP